MDLVGLKPNPYEHYFLQCFDSVGWVIWPIKPIPDMTYVFSGTLNPTQSMLLHIQCWVLQTRCNSLLHF